LNAEEILKRKKKKNTELKKKAKIGNFTSLLNFFLSLEIKITLEIHFKIIFGTILHIPFVILMVWLENLRKIQ
jgi:hypothetical protein